MKNKYIRDFIKNTKELAASQFLIALILLIQVAIVSRGLGTDGYGKAVLITSLAAIVFRTLHARNSDVTILLLKQNGKKVLINSMLFDFLIGLLGFLISSLFFLSSFNKYFGDYEYGLYLVIFLISKVFQTFSESAKAYLTFLGEFKKFAIVETISNILRFLILAILFFQNPTINNFLIGYASYGFAYGLFSIWICKKDLNFSKLSIVEIKNFYNLYKKDYLKQRFDQIVGILPQHFDVIILSVFTDYSTVGIFRIAKRLVEPVNYLISVFNPVVQNNLSNNLQYNTKKLVFQITLPITSFLVTLYIFFGRKIIEIIAGAEFLNSYDALLILLIGYMVYFNLFWTRQVLLFNSLIQYHALARIVNTLTFLTVSWSLVPSIGSNGLAIALSVGMVIQKIIEYIFVSKTKKKP